MEAEFLEVWCVFLHQLRNPMVFIDVSDVSRFYRSDTITEFCQLCGIFIPMAFSLSFNHEIFLLESFLKYFFCDWFVPKVHRSQIRQFQVACRGKYFEENFGWGLYKVINCWKQTIVSINYVGCVQLRFVNSFFELSLHRNKCRCVIKLH